MASTELPFWFREYISWSLRLVGVEELPPRATQWPGFFDNTDGIGPVKRELFYKHSSGVMLPFKGRPSPVDVSRKIGVEAHITAAAFGVSKNSKAFWKKLITTGDVPEEEWRRFGDDVDEAVLRMGLHQRFWKVPYHWVALLNGDVLHNNDITRYTYHGNDGNGPLIGLSLEGNFPGLEKNRKPKHNGYDEFTIDTARAAMRLSVEDSRGKGAPVEILRAHRQYSPGRRGDPGEGWWKEIGLPMAKELHLTIDTRFKDGTGRTIPTQWDPNGFGDY